MTRLAISDLAFDVANPADDRDLRSLMARIPLPGEITLAMERDPDFFLGSSIEGDVHQTILAREPESGRVVGMGSRSVRDLWVDGRPRRVGYLGQLRIDPEYRGMKRMLQSGYGLLRGLHSEGDADFYLTSIAQDNTAARRFLEAGLPGLPTYRPVATLRTLVLPTGRRWSARRDALAAVAPAGPEDLGDISRLLMRHHGAHQFAPVWRTTDLRDPDRVRGLSPRDFLVAISGGRLAGCAAVWDQREYKQVKVVGYGPRLSWWRGPINAVAPFAGLPRLADPGERLRLGYLSHLAVEPWSPETAVALIQAGLEQAAARGLDYLSLGLDHRSPLAPALSRYFQFVEYRTVNYVVYWPDGAKAVSELGPRLPLLEIAVL